MTDLVEGRVYWMKDGSGWSLFQYHGTSPDGYHGGACIGELCSLVPDTELAPLLNPDGLPHEEGIE